MARGEVPQHLSMLAVTQKHKVLAQLQWGSEHGMRMGFAGGRTSRGGNFTVNPGDVITKIGDTDREFGTYMETLPAEHVAEAERIGLISPRNRNLHPEQFKDHT